MARSISEIKEEMTVAFMADPIIQVKYGFAQNSVFETSFSKISFENILFFIIAVSIWSLEKLFDIHSTEINTLLDTKMPHRLKWYRDKALSFQYDRSLTNDTDTYNEIVEAEKVVKYAAVLEWQGKLYIKVAKGSTNREPLDPIELIALQSYFSKIKDAGVKIELVNQPPDHFTVSIDIYYDPMVYKSNGFKLSDNSDAIREAIKLFIQTLPFNGEYRNAALVDMLQSIDGVIIPELKLARAMTHDSFIADGTWQSIQAKYQPRAGYLQFYVDTDLALVFIPYQATEL